MKHITKYILPTFFALASLGAGAHAQFYKLHGASLSAGGTGQFNTNLESSPVPATYTSQSGQTSTVAGQQQFTSWSAGFLTSLQFHPVSWAGVEMNYGYTRYSEEYAFHYASSPSMTDSLRIPVNQHEATAAYLFHPRHILFQPFLGIGGGAIDFNPAFGAKTGGSNQWRGAGLLEMGFDLPTTSKHIMFRIEGRSLYYRAPNFYTPAISTRTWRIQTEPVVSAVYRF